MWKGLQNWVIVKVFWTFAITSTYLNPFLSNVLFWSHWKHQKTEVGKKKGLRNSCLVTRNLIRTRLCHGCNYLCVSFEIIEALRTCIFQGTHCTKNEFSIKDFLSKCDQISRKLQIWSHSLKKSLMENFIFCAVTCISQQNFSLNLKQLFWYRRQNSWKYY